MTRPEEVARGLTAAQKRVVLESEPDQILDRRHGPHTKVWSNLYRKGILSHIMAGGWMFYDLTDFGKAIRRVLEEER